MADPTLQTDQVATQKPYAAFEFDCPIDLDLKVPNYYFKLVDVTDPDFFFEVHLKSDDFLAEIGKTSDKVFHIWLPVDYDYKNFNYFLLLNKDFTKPTYITTLAARPKIMVQEKGDFIFIKFVEKNKVVQQVLVDKTRLRVIYLDKLYIPGVTEWQ